MPTNRVGCCQLNVGHRAYEGKVRGSGGGGPTYFSIVKPLRKGTHVTGRFQSWAFLKREKRAFSFLTGCTSTLFLP